MSGSSREALPNVQVWWGVPPKCQGVVGRPSRMSRCGGESLPNVREWLGGRPECLLVV